MVSIKLLSLYMHWCIADSVRYVLFSKKPPSESEEELRAQAGDDLVEQAHLQSGIWRMSVLYGLEYVVVEGYKELGDSFDPVDTLLAQTVYVDKLRLFRNAIFHYQPKPINHKQLGFLEEAGSEIWIQGLHKAFESYFRQSLPIDEYLKGLKAEEKGAGGVSRRSRGT